MPKVREEQSVRVSVEFYNHLACKKLKRARQKLIPINKLFEQLLIQADLDYFKSQLEDKFPV